MFSLYQNKGPIPFGFEPTAPDFVMLPLLVCNVPIARMQFFHHGFLKQLHSRSVLELCRRGKTLVRSRPFSVRVQVLLSHRMELSDRDQY
jgi:hypothetical protein